MITYFNKAYLDFLFIQRTRLKTEYGLSKKSSEEDICAALTQLTNKDYDLIKQYLPIDLNNCNILDIGCGLATIDLAISRQTKNSVYYLLDKTEAIDSNRKFNGFNKEYVFYNDMDLLAEFIKNNIKDNDFVAVNAGEQASIKEKFKLIISLLSCGWHYSLDTYLAFIKEHLTEDGCLVIDVRNGTEEDILYKTFHNVNRLYNSAEKRHDGGIVGYRYVCNNII
jgi:SAM-dependent methyltransferase